MNAAKEVEMLLSTASEENNGVTDEKVRRKKKRKKLEDAGGNPIFKTLNNIINQRQTLQSKYPSNKSAHFHSTETPISQYSILQCIYRVTVIQIFVMN